jgi:purine-nucleoside phosphorylase
MSALRIPGIHFSAVPDFDLLAAAVAAARAAGRPCHVGPLFSSDTFYADRPEVTAGLIAHGTLAVEMEAAALYGVAAAEHRKALTVATITDHLVRHERMSADERETRFEDMVGIALRALLDTE